MSGSGAGVVIVGAGLGGIRVAENLRNNGFADPITLVGAEDHPPYDRPPLSKSVLLGKDDRVDLKPAEFYAESDITLRLGSAVTSVSPADRTVTLASGDTAVYDTLVLATGLDPRPFPGLADTVAGVHMIRTYDDAIALREDIDSASTAVVIGAGFIGCEVAASLTSRGLSVSLVEPAPPRWRLRSARRSGSWSRGSTPTTAWICAPGSVWPRSSSPTVREGRRSTR
ncbi:putative ferredoxin reductase [Gordonia alkanivorans NBRC 16433]|uniref:Putative ferredoxin reductase n=1 Tax=Gordonia alkanivorans NBRC 16433 TaxID=1027371 RepID=F9W014_9ACTN|nr:putative ferredoxin reductase [Gordonia alkanivorans NBRC 16433]